jgi:GDSL-like Lipase/Acylhydrolase family
MPARSFFMAPLLQGGCANTAGSDLVSRIGRKLDHEVINLGFSGSGKGEPELARLISEIQAGMFVLDYAANVDCHALQSTLPVFLAILRSRHPVVPIVLLSPLIPNQALWDSARKRDVEAKRDIVMEIYLSVKGSGDRNIHFVDGVSLLNPGLGGVYVDGIHPTSEGFFHISECLTAHIFRVLRA